MVAVAALGPPGHGALGGVGTPSSRKPRDIGLYWLPERQGVSFTAEIYIQMETLLLIP